MFNKETSYDNLDVLYLYPVDTEEEALINWAKPIEYFCDTNRHIVCKPYSKENLHKMVENLNIKKCWFHKDHYDMPKRRIEEITDKCILIDSKEIIKLINNV